MEVELSIEPNTDVSAAELESMSLDLRRRLLEFHDLAVESPRSGTTPDGAKSVESVNYAILAVVAAPATIRSAIDLVKVWASSRPLRTLRMKVGEDEIELAGVSSEAQSKAIDAFLRRL